MCSIVLVSPLPVLLFPSPPTSTTRHVRPATLSAPSFRSTCMCGSICLMADIKPLRVETCTTGTFSFSGEDTHKSSCEPTVSTRCRSNFWDRSCRENVREGKHEVLIVTLRLGRDFRLFPDRTECTGLWFPFSPPPRNRMNRIKNPSTSHVNMLPSRTHSTRNAFGVTEVDIDRGCFSGLVKKFSVILESLYAVRKAVEVVCVVLRSEMSEMGHQ